MNNNANANAQGNQNNQQNGRPGAGPGNYNQNSYNQANNNTGNYNTPNYNSGKQYPKRRSTATIIVAIALILMGVSYIVNTFLPWVFAWLDSGLVFATVAIIAGFGLLFKR